MTEKQCPCCADAALEPIWFDSHEVDRCHACGGLWFEKDELNAVIADSDDDIEAVTVEPYFGAHAGRNGRPCPDCGRGLHAYHLLDRFKVEIDHCRDCDGTWVDGDELDKVLRQPRVKAALERLNARVNVRTWFFQLLTQLPVEYNIRPRGMPWITIALVVINTVLFASYKLRLVDPVTVLEPLSASPMEFWMGADWWAPLTAMFLHAGWVHLLGNMYFLYVIGDNLEDALGRWRFLGIYLVCGLIAGLARMVVEPDSMIPSIGASGAVAGLFGMYLLWFRHASLTFMFIVYQKKLRPVWFFGIWLAVNLFGMANGSGAVDHTAHVVGLGAGLVFGWLLHKQVIARRPMLRVLAAPEVDVAR